MFKVDKIGQLFTPCYKTLLRQTTFIGVVNVVQISLLVLWMCTDSPWRQKIIHSNGPVLLGFFIHTNCGSLVYILRFSLLSLIRKQLLKQCKYSVDQSALLTGFRSDFTSSAWTFCRWVADVIPRETSSAAKREEKRLFSQATFTFDRWYVTLVSCSTKWATSLGLLGCLFGPKVYILLFRPEQNTVECVRSQVSNFPFNNALRTRVLSAPVNTGLPNNALEPENVRACT